MGPSEGKVGDGGVYRFIYNARKGNSIVSFIRMCFVYKGLVRYTPPSPTFCSASRSIKGIAVGGVCLVGLLLESL